MAWKVNPLNGATSGFPSSLAETHFAALPESHYDRGLPFEVHTDKDMVKFVPCLTCQRACVVTVFYVPAWMKACKTCSGESDAGKGTVAVPQAGRTDPAKAVNLADCLLNEGFADVLCPIDAAHGSMELKSVGHNDNYGPSTLVGYDKGMPVYEVTTGESVMHQCNECLCVVTMSTTHMAKYRRKNEPQVKTGNGSTWRMLAGAREEGE